MICGNFFTSSWYSSASAAASYLLLSWLLKGRDKKKEVYSLIPSLIRRIDRACESYSPPTIHFFVVAPNPIIVPPHSTPPRRPLRIRAGLWPFLFLIFLFFFSYFFSSLLSFLMEYGFSAPILFLS